jgi:hypothetical protein
MTPDALPPDFRNIFAKVFEQIGGVKSLTNWARNHKTIFYSSMFKTLPQQIDQHVTHHDDGETRESAIAKLTDSFARIIDARKKEEELTGLVKVGGVNYRRNADGSLVPTEARLPSDGVISDCSTGVTIEHNAQPPHLNIHTFADFVSGDDAAPQQPPRLVAAKPSPAPPDDGISKPPKPDATARHDATRQLTPAEARERAMQPSFPTPKTTEPSTTALALEWMGKGRMRWEPPPGW